MNEWMNKYMNKWMNEWINEWMNEWTNERMNEWTNERRKKWKKMNEWMNKKLTSGLTGSSIPTMATHVSSDTISSSSSQSGCVPSASANSIVAITLINSVNSQCTRCNLLQQSMYSNVHSQKSMKKIRTESQW